MLTEEQQKFISQKQNHCIKNIPVLKKEEVHQICIDFDFEEEKIDEYFRHFEIEAKYKDLPAFQW